MLTLVNELKRVTSEIVSGCDPIVAKRHTDRGKLLVRQRIDKLLGEIISKFNIPLLALSLKTIKYNI